MSFQRLCVSQNYVFESILLICYAQGTLHTFSVQKMLVTLLRPCISKPGFRHHKLCRCVCVLSVSQMLEKYVVAKLADIIPFVANHQDLIWVCVLHALAAVCL